MAETSHRDSKPVVITVHGTGDTAPSGEGAKWFQNGSSFAAGLKQSLASHGVEAEVIPHLWSGANSSTAREQGAVKLAKKVRQLARQGREVHLVGHSHGGNVANDAACILAWSSKERRPKLASVTTVGTPFFRTHVTLSEWLGAWAFVVMTVLSVLFVVLTLAAFLLLDPFGAMNRVAPAEQEIASIDLQLARPDLSEEERTRLAMQQQELQFQVATSKELANLLGTATGVFVIPTALILAFMFPLALRGLARTRRAGRKSCADPSLFSIWHPNDEAIAFLMRMEELPLEPFPRWSFLRGSRTGAVVWGIRAALTSPLAGLVLIAAGLAAGLAGISPMILETDVSVLGFALLAYGLAVGPMVFAIVYFLYRAAVALFLEFWLRGPLNKSIGGVLTGIAFGRDGDNRIGNVATCSHYYGVKRAVLEGDLATRMLKASGEATRALFDRYRGSLFAVGADNSNAVNQLATDAMTWNSLIHTTYFDQPEIADMIAAHIAQTSKRSRRGAAGPAAQAA